MLICGTKPFEIRSWKTDYRGRIALHASSGTATDALDRGADEDVWAECFALAGLVTKADVKALRRSAIIGTIEIQEIGTVDDLEDSMSEAELDLFGDLDDDLYLWRMSDPILIEPIAIDGKLNLWTLPDDVAAQVAQRESEARIRPPDRVSDARISAAKSQWRVLRAEREEEKRKFMAAPVRIVGPLAAFMGADKSTRESIYLSLLKRCDQLPTTDDDRTIMDAELRAIVGGRNKYLSRYEIASASVRYIEDI